MDEQQNQTGFEFLFQNSGLPLDLLVQSKIDIQHLLCFICKQILWRPVTCNQPNCFTNFCQECLINLQKSTFEHNNNGDRKCPIQAKQCPNCKLRMQRTKLPLIKNLLNDITLKCLNYKNGCQQIVRYQHFQKHFHTCPYRKIKCQGCSMLYLKSTIQQHTQKCEQFLVQCQKCNFKSRRDQMRQHIEVKCLEEQLSRKNIHLKKIEGKVQELCKKVQKYELIMQKLLTGEPLELEVSFYTSFPHNFRISSVKKEVSLQKASFNVEKQKYDFLHFYIQTPINTGTAASFQWRMRIKVLSGNILVGLCSSLNSNSLDFIINKHGQIKKKQLDQNRYRLIRKSQIFFTANDVIIVRFISVERKVQIYNQTKSIKVDFNRDQVSSLGKKLYSFYSLDTLGDTIQFF